MTTKLARINTGAVNARFMLRELHRLIASVKDVHGDKLAGFVLVTWDQRGDGFVAANVENGPIGHHMLPVYAHDQLLRFEASRSAQVAPIENFTPPEGT